MGDSCPQMNLWRFVGLWVIPNGPTLELLGQVSVSWVWSVPTLPCCELFMVLSPRDSFTSNSLYILCPHTQKPLWANMY